MQLVLIILILVLFSLYILLILYYWRSWLSVPDFGWPVSGFTPSVKITVIIPARNEEDNIAACLDSVSRQTYPTHLYEVLVVDDHSTDDTAALIKSHRSQNVKLISLQAFVPSLKLNSYKKKAIEVAISQSAGELIVTTDADCQMPENWLYAIAAFYEQYKPEFIAAPVSIHCSFRFIEMFQAIDFATLQGITAASVHKKTHSMCNGANLAYTKKAFEEVGGFAGIDNIASGDDMLLMHKIYKRHPDKVMFLKSKEAIVQTRPIKSVGAFFNQRIRWASKAGRYNDKRIFGVLLLVYLVNLLLLLLPVISLFYTPLFHLQLYSFTLSITFFELWICLLISKSFVELVFLYPVATFFNKQKLLWLFPLMQPFHIIYTIVAGWLGAFGTYTWKERRVK